jgi:hypothetical protein
MIETRVPYSISAEPLPPYKAVFNEFDRTSELIRRFNLASQAAKKTVALVVVTAGLMHVTAESAKADSGLPIPEDLPDITRTHWTGYDGDGAWITASPSGYYLGRVFQKDEFMQIDPSPSGDYASGIVVRKNENKPAQCGWVEAKEISDEKVYENPYNICDEYLKLLKNREYFGYGFNCDKSKCVGGAPNVELSDRCDSNFYYNYAPDEKSFNNLTFPDTPGGFYDYAGKEQGPVSYRFRIRGSGKPSDKGALVVKSDKYGWGFMRLKCKRGNPQGGPKKTEDTVAGPNPNGGDSKKFDSNQ